VTLELNYAFAPPPPSPAQQTRAPATTTSSYSPPPPPSPSPPPPSPHPAKATGGATSSSSNQVQKFKEKLTDFDRRHAQKVIACIEACRSELATVFVQDKDTLLVTISDKLIEFQSEERVQLKEEVNHTRARLEEELGSLDQALSRLYRQFHP